MAKEHNNNNSGKRSNTAQPKISNFRINRTKKIREMYADEPSSSRALDKRAVYQTSTFANAKAVRKALEDAITNKDKIVEASKKLYVTNPIYAAVINYLSNMFMWRYKVIPHRVYTKSKAKARKQINSEDYSLIYSLMLEVVDGLNLEIKMPKLLATLFIEGGVYFTTVSDDESLTIDTLILPSKYCRAIGQTQFGTSLIQFDFSYFESKGLMGEELKTFLKTFPQEFQSKYNKYAKNNDLRWQTLDPHFSTGILANEMSIPTHFYLLGGILDYEQYQDNELERNENLLKYLVVHTMPHYEDQLIFEMDEVAEAHRSIKRIVDTGDKARLVTTWGDIHVEQVGRSEATENEVLSKAFKSIFNNAGFNSALFSGESVTALNNSLIRDKGAVWGYTQSILNFYTIAVNNWFEFKNYQADIEILPISSYTYNDDIEVYKNNATLGVGKLDYFIASGIKQKNISDTLVLEKFLKLDEITPMQTSFTQTADDRKGNEDDEKTDDGDKTKTVDNKKDDPKAVDKEGESNTPSKDDDGSNDVNTKDEGSDKPAVN